MLTFPILFTVLFTDLENLAAVNAKLAKELATGCIAGPFGVPPFPDFMISPLGLVPKKTPSESRLIHHLSFPRSSSLNDGIPRGSLFRQLCFNR